MTLQHLELGLRDVTDTAGSCSGGACACGPVSAASLPAAQGRTATVTTSLQVTGMTCEHCVRAVTEQVEALDGVAAVDVQLVADGASRVSVHSDHVLDRDALAAAVERAGYSLAG